MTDRIERLVNYGYAICETKNYVLLGKYSKNASNFWKRVFHYFPSRIVKK